MTMMTDRDLLEAAARAAGIDFAHYDKGKGLCREVPAGHAGVRTYWNPLTDDGDALRLAVKLQIAFTFGFEGTSAYEDARGIETPYIRGPDPYAATRRAIVRAAAAMDTQPLPAPPSTQREEGA